jgi:hypothetical protein
MSLTIYHLLPVGILRHDERILHPAAATEFAIRRSSTDWD